MAGLAVMSVCFVLETFVGCFSAVTAYLRGRHPNAVTQKHFKVFKLLLKECHPVRDFLQYRVLLS